MSDLGMSFQGRGSEGSARASVRVERYLPAIVAGGRPRTDSLDKSVCKTCARVDENVL
jgi:hypothetical protein